MPTPPQLGDYRVAVVLINFTNDTRQPYTPAFAEGTVFSFFNSARQFFAESSYGQMMLTGDVFGWWTVPYPNNPCDTLAWKNAARSMALAQGVDLDADYDHVALAWPRTSACQFNGRAGSFYNTDSLDEQAVIHEMGHGLSLSHANGRICTDAGVPVPLSSTCVDREYDDYYDSMGNQSGHWYSSWARTKLGWLPPPLTVTTSGTYNLDSAEEPTGQRLIMVPRPDGTYFALEYRRPAGVFDQWRGAYSPTEVDGVFVRIATASTDITHQTNTFLLDMSPTGLEVGHDPALRVGNSFTYDGITITTLAIDATHATVGITLGG